MKINIITVTYGKRFEFLKQVLDSVLKDKFTNKVILVDNNSDNKEEIDTYINKNNTSENKKEIILVRHKENTGSAGGFSSGIEEARKHLSDYVLLLDDDNVPEEDWGEQIFLWLNIFKKEKIAPIFSLERESGNSNFFYSKESFLKKKDLYRFRIGNLKQFIAFIKYGRKDIFKDKYSFIPIKRFSPCGYGGVFIPYNIICDNKISIPKYYFVYFDDVYFFSKLIEKYNIPIYKLSSPKIKDVDFSFEKSNIYKSFFANNSNNIRVFYWIRNRILLTIENSPQSKLSIFIYSFIWVFYIILLGTIYYFNKITLKNYLLKVEIIFTAFISGIKRDKRSFENLGLKQKSY